MIKRSDHKCSILFDWEIVEVRPQQASMLACVALAGTSERLAGQEFLRELIVGVLTPSDLAGSF